MRVCLNISNELFKKNWFAFFRDGSKAPGHKAQRERISQSGSANLLFVAGFPRSTFRLNRKKRKT
jgi:hypothetical protein